MIAKRKKVTKQRGNWTHGWGAKKKHRGAGNRGGRGMAGTGKRGDCKKPMIWKNTKYFGVHGFSPRKNTDSSITTYHLEQSVETLAKKGLINKEGDFYIINLADLGHNKLLSKGNVTKKLKITCELATEKAIEKIKNSGGQVIVTAINNKEE